MSRISSTTLFNFTNKFEHLENNLKDGFHCQNTYEKLPLKNNGYAVPMVCFCDIPLSLIKEHFDWYGRFGIGINRSFTRKQGVTPVWYVTSENRLVHNLVESKNVSRRDKDNLLPYLKQFMGYQSYQDGTLKKKKFYDEHEWRYIPPDAVVQPMLGIKRTTAENDVKPTITRWVIDPSHIEYIIIEDEKFIDPILKAIKSLSVTKSVSYEGLVSKLLTAKQIERDF